MKFTIINKRRDVPELVGIIADHFGLTAADIYKPCKKREYVSARFCVYHVLRNTLEMSFTEAGAWCKRDHGSVLQGCRTLSDWCEHEPLANRTRVECEQLATKWVAATGYPVGTRSADCALPVSKPSKGEETKKQESKGKVAFKAGVTPEVFTKPEDTLYLYKYNNNKSIGFKLERQLHSPLVFKALVEYIEYRMQIGKRITQLSMDKLMSKLAIVNSALVIDALEKSIANGWTGVFFNDNKTKNNKTNNSGYNAKAKADYSGAVNKRANEKVGEIF